MVGPGLDYGGEFKYRSWGQYTVSSAVLRTRISLEGGFAAFSIQMQSTE